MNRLILPKQKYQTQYAYKHRSAAVNYGRVAAGAYENHVSRHAERRHNITSIALKQSYKRKKEFLFLSIMVVSLIITGVAFISQYGMVLSKNHQIQHTTQEISRLEEEKDNLRLQVRQLSSLERIETIAIDELGMQYPEDKQWLMISASNN